MELDIEDDDQTNLPDAAWTEPPIRGHRSTADRYVAGVLGGIGERLDVDPTILRVVTVAVAILMRDDLPFAVPIAYALGWIVVPEPGRGSLLGTATRRVSQQEIGGAIVAAIVASFALATPSIWFACGLGAVAWFLLSERRAPRRDDLDVTEEGLGTSSATLGGEPPEWVVPTTQSSASPDTALWHDVGARWGRTRRGQREPLGTLRLRPQRETRPRREPALWPLTLALLAIWVVICAAIDNVTDPGLDPSVGVNGALIIVGGVIALSAWRGRSGWTALLLVPLLPLWLAFSASDIGRYPGSGSRSLTVDAVPEGGAVTVEHGYGDLEVFVSEDALPKGETLQLTTAMTVGSTRISVPDNATVVMRSQAGIGVVEVEGDVDGYRWHTDHTLVLSHHRNRRYRPILDECYVQQMSPEEVGGHYAEWLNMRGLSVETLPDFTDPATAQYPDVLEMLSFDLPESPNVEVVEGGAGVIWQVARDDWGRPCDPDAEPDVAGTIEIDATIGLGRIDIVRHITNP